MVVACKNALIYQYKAKARSYQMNLKYFNRI